MVVRYRQLNWSTARRRTLFKKNTFTHQVPIRCCSVITRGFVEDAAHLRNAPYQGMFLTCCLPER